MMRPVFVIPHYSASDRSWYFLDRTLDSLIHQSDPDWQAIVVDDASPPSDSAARLDAARARDPARIHVVPKRTNDGPGAARNLGVAWARDRGAPFVLFLDADDRSHPDRLEITRGCFRERYDVGFVYSTFEIVDEHERLVPAEDLTPSIREILNGHASNPVDGPDQWLRIALEKGYTTCTSTVAVRTQLAAAHPFPSTRVSEDSHTWLRMLATGVTVKYIDAPLVSRRICSGSSRGSSTRERFGDDFYWIKLQVDLDGFTRALDIARARGAIGPRDEMLIRRGFHLRQAKTMAGERQTLPASVCQGLASLPLPEFEAKPAPAYANAEDSHDEHSFAAASVAVGRR